MSYSASDFVNDIEQGMTDHNIPEADRAAWCRITDEIPDENDEEQNLRILAERACCAFNSLNEIVGGYVVLRAALIGTITLIEKWANGPLFKAAGITWPEGGCNAPALLAARAALGGVK